MLLKATVLSDEQIEKYSDIMDELPIEDSNKFSYEDYENDCRELAKTCVDSFKAVTNGFVATSSFETDRFVVFTVPWESGWSATINGEPAEIEKVNRGVMGIKVPAGECEIKFDYVTPGLKAGAAATAGAAVILIIYYIVLRKVFKYKPNPDCHLYGEQQLDKIINHNAYINTLARDAQVQNTSDTGTDSENMVQETNDENTDSTDSGADKQ